MIQPVKAKANARAVEDIVSAIGSLRVVVFEADSEYDPANYGLAQPRITIVLQSTVDDRIRELQIGSDAQEHPDGFMLHVQISVPYMRSTKRSTRS